jgi:hypothetical protein
MNTLCFAQHHLLKSLQLFHKLMLYLYRYPVLLIVTDSVSQSSILPTSTFVDNVTQDAVPINDVLVSSNTTPMEMEVQDTPLQSVVNDITVEMMYYKMLYLITLEIVYRDRVELLDILMIILLFLLMLQIYTLMMICYLLILISML